MPKRIIVSTIIMVLTVSQVLFSFPFHLPEVKEAHAACTGVTISPGQSIQAAVDANPSGTTFCIKVGIHRAQQVYPKDNMTFIGEPGTILNGTKVLSAASFVQSGTTWYIGGQTQRLGSTSNGNPSPEGYVPGYACEAGWNEELFVNNTMRVRRVCSLSEVVPGKWYFDRTASRIYMGDNPTSFSLIETSAAELSFAAYQPTSNVRIENMIIEKYGSNANGGAIGGGWTAQYGWATQARHWTIRYVTARHNHADGIHVGPGFLVENCKMHENGQFGVQSNGKDQLGYTAFATFRNNEVFRNGVVGYSRGWGAGGSKFSWMYGGTLVENNWFHENYGPGIWFDIDNYNTTIRSNLSENNGIELFPNEGGGVGIFYEISYGPTKIYWNISRNNREIGIWDSSSSDVEIYENAVYGNRIGINAIHDSNRTPGLNNLYVHHNDVMTSTNAELEFLGSNQGITDGLSRATYNYNTYRNYTGPGSEFSNPLFRVNGWGSNSVVNFTQWQGHGLDVNGTVLSSGTPTLPAHAVPFNLSQYGQQETVSPTPTPTPSSTTGPIAHWKLDETSGTTASDSAGTYSGTLTNGPVWTTGKINNALSFDGTDDYVTAGTGPTLANQSFTVSAWAKRNTTGTDDWLFTQGSAATNKASYHRLSFQQHVHLRIL